VKDASEMPTDSVAGDSHALDRTTFAKVQRALYLTRIDANSRERRTGMLLTESLLAESLPSDVTALLRLQKNHSKALGDAQQEMKLVKRAQQKPSSAAAIDRHTAARATRVDREEAQELHLIIYRLSADLANANSKLKQLAAIEQAIQDPNTPAVK